MKALALFSGGLDSALAIKLIQAQNIEVEGVYINIGFESNKNKIDDLKKLANNLKIEFLVIDAVDEYIEKVLFSPKYGYGKNLNPCIDCHAFMVKKALEIMEKRDAKFIIDGEVVNQRPMSQRKDAMRAIDKLSNANNLLLRPLSAKLLPPTLPEIKGWVEREKLLAISGRDRNIQLELAKKFNLEGFESPSGGCLLTDINFTKRVKDYHKYLPLTKEEIDILKVGRHFNIDGYKVIISRNRDENEILKKYKGDLFIKAYPKFKGPIGLIQKNTPLHIKELASNMIASYSKEEGEVIIDNESFKAKKMDKSSFKQYLI